jgi:hypothetical protein
LEIGIVAGDAIPHQVRWNREILNIVETISTQLNGI